MSGCWCSTATCRGVCPLMLREVMLAPRLIRSFAVLKLPFAAAMCSACACLVRVCVCVFVCLHVVCPVLGVQRVGGKG